MNFDKFKEMMTEISRGLILAKGGNAEVSIGYNCDHSTDAQIYFTPPKTGNFVIPFATVEVVEEHKRLLITLEPDLASEHDTEELVTAIEFQGDNIIPAIVAVIYAYLEEGIIPSPFSGEYKPTMH